MRSDLSLAVDSDDPRRRVVWRRHKDGVSTDAVHVDTGGRLYVVQVDVAVLGDDVDHVVLWTHLTTMPQHLQVTHTRALVAGKRNDSFILFNDSNSGFKSVQRSSFVLLYSS